MKNLKLPLCLGVALVASASQAQITYVDAADGPGANTTLVGGAQWGPLTLGTQGPANDGIWDKRVFGNGGTIYQNAGTTAGMDNAHRLQSTITGLTLGTYDVYAYFWSDNSFGWRMGASLVNEAGELPVYVPGDPGVTQFHTGADGTVLSGALGSNPFDSATVVVSEGNRRLFQIPVGQVTGSSITVFIDDFAGMATQNQRTWLDGIGFAPVAVPEPATGALLGLSAVAGILFVRRKRG